MEHVWDPLEDSKRLATSFRNLSNEWEVHEISASSVLHLEKIGNKLVRVCTHAVEELNGSIPSSYRQKVGTWERYVKNRFFSSIWNVSWSRYFQNPLRAPALSTYTASFRCALLLFNPSGLDILCTVRSYTKLANNPMTALKVFGYVDVGLRKAIIVPTSQISFC